MDRRGSEQIDRRLALELPGGGFFGVRRRRERLKFIGVGLVVDR